MKVTYEFENDYESDDFYHLKIFQIAQNMLKALEEIEDYIRQIQKEYLDHDKEQMIAMILDVIYESRIKEIE